MRSVCFRKKRQGNGRVARPRFILGLVRVHYSRKLGLWVHSSLPWNRWTACSPHRGQLRCRTHSAPTSESATAQTLTSDLRLGGPRLFRVSGAGKSFSFVSHSLQYTVPCVWARYQRQPHPSQTFNCTRNSIGFSEKRPISALVRSFSFFGELREPGKTTQVSSVLIKEICLVSLIPVYIFRAQIWKLAHACPVCLFRAIAGGNMSRESESINL